MCSRIRNNQRKLLLFAGVAQVTLFARYVLYLEFFLGVFDHHTFIIYWFKSFLILVHRQTTFGHTMARNIHETDMRSEWNYIYAALCMFIRMLIRECVWMHHEFATTPHSIVQWASFRIGSELCEASSSWLDLRDNHMHTHMMVMFIWSCRYMHIICAWTSYHPGFSSYSQHHHHNQCRMHITCDMNGHGLKVEVGIGYHHRNVAL